MAVNDNLKKLRFKGLPKILFIPDNLKDELKDSNLPKPYKEILAFINDKNELINFFENDLKDIEYDANFWIAYPKQSSKIKTDINRDSIWKISLEYKIRPVSNISLSDVWSAIRFRPTEAVKSRVYS